MTGDGDIVHLEHTLALYRALRESELAVVPGTSHVLLHEKPEPCARLVEAFLTEDFPNGRGRSLVARLTGQQHRGLGRSR
jgi:hypothetical protein